MATVKRRRKKKNSGFPYWALAMLVIAVIGLGVLIGLMVANKTKPVLPDASSETTSQVVESLPPAVTSEVQSQDETSIPEETSEVPVIVPGSPEAFLAVSYAASENSSRYVSYAEEHPEFTAEQIVTYVNLGLDREFYAETKEALNKESIYILVNKNYSVEKSDKPTDMRDVSMDCASRENVPMREEAATAFETMSRAAKAEGYSVLAYSGYRSIEFQSAIYNNYCKKDPQSVVDTYSARAGYSEHHTGLAVDVRTETVGYDDFGTTKEYTWVQDNSYKYGFVIHYTSENQWITGYKTEEWHLRYIGVEAAQVIHETGLSVDEYIIRYHPGN